MYPTGPGRLHLTLALVAFAALLFAQQQQIVAFPHTGRIAEAAPDAIHGSWFAVVTFVLLFVVDRYVFAGRRPPRVVMAVVAVAGFTLAVGTELLQALTGGDAEAGDVFFDMVGMSAALCIWSTRRGLLAPWLGYGLATALWIGSLWPLWPAYAIDRCRDAIAPDLIRFDVPCTRRLFVSKSAPEIVAAPQPWDVAGPVLKLTLNDETYPGVSIVDVVRDWRPYAALRIDAFVDARALLPVTISIRIDHAPVDHVYRTFDCAPGPCRLELALAGLFDRDVARVNSVVIYSRRAAAGRVLYLGRVQLER